MALGDPSKIHLPGEGYPPATLPTTFSDGVFNIVPGPQVTKFYLQRLASSLTGTNDFLPQPILQVIMPTQAFLQMSIFFEDAIKDMQEKNLISKEVMDHLRKEYEQAKEQIKTKNLAPSSNI